MIFNIILCFMEKMLKKVIVSEHNNLFLCLRMDDEEDGKCCNRTQF